MIPLDSYKQKRSLIDEQNKTRLEDYQKQVAESEARSLSANDVLLKRAYGAESQEPYTLKAMSAPSATARSIEEQERPSATSQQVQQPSATAQAQSPITSGLAGIGANSLFSSGAASGAPAAPTMVSATPGSVGSFGPAGAMGAAPAYAYALPAIGTALAAKSAYDIFKGNPEDKSPSGLIGRGQLAFTSMGASELARLVGFGKHKDQKQRDGIRGNLQQGGILDGDYNLTLADGSKWDMGKDGSIQNYNIDPEGTPYTKDVIDWTNPIGLILGKGDKKIQSDFTGYFSNAAISNAPDAQAAKANVQAFYDQIGMTKGQWEAEIDALAAKETISKQDADIYKSKLSQFNFKAEEGQSSGVSMPSFGGFNISMPKQPKPLPPPPPQQNMDFSLLNMVQNQGAQKQSGAVLFNNALQGILGK